MSLVSLLVSFEVYYICKASALSLAVGLGEDCFSTNEERSKTGDEDVSLNYQGNKVTSLKI